MPGEKPLPRRKGAFGEDLGPVEENISYPVPRVPDHLPRPVPPPGMIADPPRPMDPPGMIADPPRPADPPGILPGPRPDIPLPIPTPIPVPPPLPDLPGRDPYKEAIARDRIGLPGEKPLPRRKGAFGEDLGAVERGLWLRPFDPPVPDDLPAVRELDDLPAVREPTPADPQTILPPPSLPPRGSVEFTEPWQKSLPTRTGAFGETLAPVQGYRRSGRSWKGWEDVPIEERESGRWRREDPPTPYPPDPRPPIEPPIEPPYRPEPVPDPWVPGPGRPIDPDLPIEPDRPRPPAPWVPSPGQPVVSPPMGVPEPPTPIPAPRERPQALSGSARFDLPSPPQDRPVKRAAPRGATKKRAATPRAAAKTTAKRRVGQVGSAPSVGRPKRGATGPRRGQQALRPRASGMARGRQPTISTLRKLLAQLEEDERRNI